MTRLVLTLLLFTLVGTDSAYADWRWADPHYKMPKAQLHSCHTVICKVKAKRIAKLKFKLKIAQYHYKKEREWIRWTRRFIPACTWYGESGYGPKYSRARYVMPNSQGSGAYGKFQFMPGTYFHLATYRDWSPLDQEITGRRLYWQQGTSPWANCH